MFPWDDDMAMTNINIKFGFYLSHAEKISAREPGNFHFKIRFGLFL